MELVKSFSRRSFVINLFFMLVLIMLLGYAFYVGWNKISADLSIVANTTADLSEAKETIDGMFLFLANLKKYAVPVAAGIFGFFLLGPWFFLRRSLIKLTDKIGSESTAGPKKSALKSVDQPLRCLLYTSDAADE